MKKITFLFFVSAVINIVTFTSSAQNTAQTGCDPVTISKVENEGAGNRITWIQPTGRGEVVITQGGNFVDNKVGLPEDFGVYHRFTPEELAIINGGKLYQFVFAPTKSSWQTEPGHTFTIQIYQGGIWGTEGNRNPGNLISSQKLNNNNLIPNKENTITLETPVTIDASQELWIGYYCINIDPVGAASVGTDEEPRKEGRGNIFFYQHQWHTVYEVASADYNWVIKGKVQTIEGATVNIYYNENKLVSNIPGATYFHTNPTGEEHCYKIEVNCSEGGVSPFSNEVCISESECHPATDLEVKYAADCSSADLTWKAPENMSGTILYNVYRNDTILISNHSDTSYTTTNFNPNIVNIWSVKVVCPEEESDAMSVTKEDCIVGVNDNIIVRFNIYPNPANNELRIMNYEFRDVVIEIYDVYGRKQKAEGRKQKAENEIVVDVSNLASGIYFIKLMDENCCAVQRFIKE